MKNIQNHTFLASNLGLMGKEYIICSYRIIVYVSKEKLCNLFILKSSSSTDIFKINYIKERICNLFNSNKKTLLFKFNLNI